VTAREIPESISCYAAAIAARLTFDRALSARVRQEVEDHLQEAAAAEGGDAQRAIARFGEPRAIAAQFAATSLVAQMSRIGITVLLVLGAAFLAMKMRLAWYEFTGWGVCEASAPLAELLSTLDRSAFLVATATGLAGFAMDGARRLFLCWMAVALLAASVLCDGALTALRLAGWEWSTDFLVPLASMAIEVACAAVLAWRVQRVACYGSAAVAP
jgi:hypothetical protein